MRLVVDSGQFLCYHNFTNCRKDKIMAMLVGEYNHQLDAKYRMRIPAKLKKALGEEYIFARGSNHCVYVFSKEQAEELLNKLQQISIFDISKQKSVRAFARTFEEVKEDGQGRVILSPELRKHTLMEKDDKDLVICGAINRVEIWSKKVYDEYFNVGGDGDDYDKLLEQLGI